MNTCLAAAIALSAISAFAAQNSSGQPTFEVASIKPSNPPGGIVSRVGCGGGPGAKDPGLLNCVNMSASNLLMKAYDVQRFRLSAPDWMDSARFDITAKIPPETTMDQFRLMQQNLLAERFKLLLHHETRDLPIYELSVAKNGPKLKKTVLKEGEAPPSVSVRGQLGSDGFPELPPNASMMIMMSDRASRQQLGENMDSFARFLSSQLGGQVTDVTGITGKYDILLKWSEGRPRGLSEDPSPSEALPTLIQAVQALGLKLEAKKGPVDILVIDHMEKTPTEN
jgi:uncharacterized protein (TIGR03435 family)